MTTSTLCSPVVANSSPLQWARSVLRCPCICLSQPRKSVKHFCVNNRWSLFGALLWRHDMLGSTNTFFVSFIGLHNMWFICIFGRGRGTLSSFKLFKAMFFASLKWFWETVLLLSNYTRTNICSQHNYRLPKMHAPFCWQTLCFRQSAVSGKMITGENMF